MKTFKKIILDDLKSQKLDHIAAKIKSIRYETFANGNSVDVNTVNLFFGEREALEKILRKYESGSFDGMTDMYSYDNRREDVERQAKFVHLRNEYSEVIRNAAKEWLKNEMGVTDDASAQHKMACWYDTAIWRTIQGLNSFDDAIKLLGGK